MFENRTEMRLVLSGMKVGKHKNTGNEMEPGLAWSGSLEHTK